MKLNTLMASLAAILMLSSCEDIFEDSSLPDGSKPDIRIASPTANRSYLVEHGFPVKLTVVDKDQIKSLTIVVKGSNGEPALVNIVKTPDVKVLELDTLIHQPSFVPGTYLLEVTATDSRTNIFTKEVSFNMKDK
ncbi:hypothetical protein [Pontibacter beigongshangensis]|uniref:hypothetical protein n=1 Tax=Pontibacter beigongshangensis TaxID=2574733 RepID=UPI001650A810|nr:hypothetical protein [Pontibacter beigongshangensis]